MITPAACGAAVIAVARACKVELRGANIIVDLKES